MSLRKFDRIRVTMDFTPNDKVDNIISKEGIFISHSEGLPAGWIPGCFVIFDDKTWGQMLPYRIVNKEKITIVELVARYDNDTDYKVIQKVIMTLNVIKSQINSINSTIVSLIDDLQGTI